MGLAKRGRWWHPAVVTSPDQQPPITQIRTPDKRAAGAYANGMGVWFTSTEFTLDFLVSLPQEMATDPTGQQFLVAPQQVVGRVKIPPPLVFHIMRNLNAALDQYEAQHGKISDLMGGDPTPPPPA